MLDNNLTLCYNKQVVEILTAYGSIAQLGEHLPYKQRVIGSSPIVSSAEGRAAEQEIVRDPKPFVYGPVVQLVRTLACHARGQGFESPSGRRYGGMLWHEMPL